MGEKSAADREGNRKKEQDGVRPTVHEDKNAWRKRLVSHLSEIWGNFSMMVTDLTSTLI